MSVFFAEANACFFVRVPLCFDHAKLKGFQPPESYHPLRLPHPCFKSRVVVFACSLFFSQGIQDLLICLEMLVAAVFFFYAFPLSDYLKNPQDQSRNSHSSKQHAHAENDSGGEGEESLLGSNVRWHDLRRASALCGIPPGYACAPFCFARRNWARAHASRCVTFFDKKLL